MKTNLAWSKACTAVLVLALAAGCGPKHKSSDSGGGSSGSSGAGAGAGAGGGGGGGGGMPLLLPDLVDGGLASQYSDSRAVAGATFLAGGEVTNAGTMNSGPFQVDFYLTQGPEVTPLDVFLGSVAMPDLMPGDIAMADLSVPMPDIAPGEWRIGWIIDAADVVFELDGTNNVVMYPIDVLVEDRYEANDSFASAFILGPAGASYAADGTIHSAADEDWFSVDQIAGSSLTATMTCPADYDLEIWAFDGTLLVSSNNSGILAESATVVAPYTGSYFIRIVPVSGAFDQNNPWTLTVDVP
ncbi:MAG: CARDB domain-containing protein [Planctomycetota bacterium]